MKTILIIASLLLLATFAQSNDFCAKLAIRKDSKLLADMYDSVAFINCIDSVAEAIYTDVDAMVVIYNSLSIELEDFAKQSYEYIQKIRTVRIRIDQINQEKRDLASDKTISILQLDKECEDEKMVILQVVDDQLRKQLEVSKKELDIELQEYTKEAERLQILLDDIDNEIRLCSQKLSITSNTLNINTKLILSEIITIEHNIKETQDQQIIHTKSSSESCRKTLVNFVNLFTNSISIKVQNGKPQSVSRAVTTNSKTLLRLKKASKKLQKFFHLKHEKTSNALNSNALFRLAFLGKVIYIELQYRALVMVYQGKHDKALEIAAELTLSLNSQKEDISLASSSMLKAINDQAKQYQQRGNELKLVTDQFTADMIIMRQQQIKAKQENADQKDLIISTGDKKNEHCTNVNIEIERLQTIITSLIEKTTTIKNIYSKELLITQNKNAQFVNLREKNINTYKKDMLDLNNILGASTTDLKQLSYEQLSSIFSGLKKVNGVSVLAGEAKARVNGQIRECYLQMDQDDVALLEEVMAKPNAGSIKDWIYSANAKQIISSA